MELSDYKQLYIFHKCLQAGIVNKEIYSWMLYKMGLRFWLQLDENIWSTALIYNLLSKAKYSASKLMATEY